MRASGISVEGLLLHVHARARLSQRFRPLQGVHAVPQAGFGTGVDVPGAAGVIDVETFGRQGRVDGGLNGGEDLLVRLSGGEPEFGSILFRGDDGGRAGGEKDSRQGSERNCAHNIVCTLYKYSFFPSTFRHPPASMCQN